MFGHEIGLYARSSILELWLRVNIYMGVAVRLRTFAWPQE
jgi:hypothetical protein